MVNANIAGAHPLGNSEGVLDLANIFHALFEHYTHYKSPMITNLFYALRTVVGLGFAACLTDAAYSACYQPHLKCFLNYDRGDFQKHPDVLGILANHVANMIFLAARNFQMNHCRASYQEFINNINDLLKNVIVTELGKGKEARKILSMLQHKEERNLSCFHP